VNIGVFLVCWLSILWGLYQIMNIKNNDIIKILENIIKYRIKKIVS